MRELFRDQSRFRFRRVDDSQIPFDGEGREYESLYDDEEGTRL